MLPLENSARASQLEFMWWHPIKPLLVGTMYIDYEVEVVTLI